MHAAASGPPLAAAPEVMSQPSGLRHRYCTGGREPHVHEWPLGRSARSDSTFNEKVPRELLPRPEPPC